VKYNHFEDKNDESAETISLGIKKLKVIKLIEVIEKYNINQCLIFVRTRLDADNLCKTFQALSSSNGSKGTKGNRGKGTSASVLGGNRYRAEVLHGGKEMEKRARIMEDFKSGEVNFLIATDIVARGIDIKELPYVINMNIPEQSEEYVHRIGRVGRQGEYGVSISFVDRNVRDEEKVWWHTCKGKGADGCRNTKDKKEGGCTMWMKEGEVW